MIGGLGDDTYVVDSATDVITEAVGEGIDLVQSSVTLTLAANVDNLTLTGTDNINGYGNALNNTLFGNTGNNLIEGRDGNDVLVGHGGSDTLDGGNGNDMLMVLPTLPTGMTINPTGSTQLIGGAGSDVFRMNLGYVGNHTAGANQLSITDFVHGQDKLNYFLDASSTTPTSLNALTVGSGGALASLVDQAAASSASKAAPTLTAFAFSGNTYVVLDQSASATFDSSTDLAIKLVGEPALTLSDFIFTKAAAA